MINRAQIQDRRDEELLRRIITDYLDEHDHQRQDYQVTDVMLSRGGHDAKICVIFKQPIDNERARLRELTLRLGPQIRHYVSQRWHGRMVPRLQFALDRGTINAQKIDAIFASRTLNDGEE